MESIQAKIMLSRNTSAAKSHDRCGFAFAFLSFLQLRFLLHMHGGDSSKIVNQSHFSPSVSMRLRNTLCPNDEQVNDDDVVTMTGRMNTWMKYISRQRRQF